MSYESKPERILAYLVNIKTTNDMNEQNPNVENKVGNYWDQRAAAARPISWMGHPFISKTFNKRIYNSSAPNWGLGLFEILKRKHLKQGKKFKKAIAVACGNGRKEMRLVKKGMVEHITLYELAKNRIEEGKILAKNMGIENKVEFVYGNAFEMEKEKGKYDLVIWLNAIHHMMDTPMAIEWSKDMLISGGFFVMDDYVGPNRFQWPRIVMETCNKARAKFPKSIFNRSEQFPKKRHQVLRVVDQNLVSGVDPSEAADSARLLEALSFAFPNRQEFLYSSGVSTLALNDISSRILDKRYEPFIEHTINLDLDLVGKGHIGFASTIAIKD